MQFLDTSERTVYRYLDMLKDLGFKIERDSGNRIWIATNGNSDVIPFTDQEADYLENYLTALSAIPKKVNYSLWKETRQEVQPNKAGTGISRLFFR